MALASIHKRSRSKCVGEGRLIELAEELYKFGLSSLSCFGERLPHMRLGAAYDLHVPRSHFRLELSCIVRENNFVLIYSKKSNRRNQYSDVVRPLPHLSRDECYRQQYGAK